MVTVTARTAIRLSQQRRLFADDGFLLVAVVFLVASMAVLWHQLDEMYVAEALVTNTATFVVITGNWMDQLFWFLKISDAFLVLSWTSVMAVKFSFLFFFRNLIDRVRGMKRYWYVVLAISTAVWIFGCGAVFAPCPYFDLRSRAYLKPSLNLAKVADTLQYPAPKATNTASPWPTPPLLSPSTS